MRLVCPGCAAVYELPDAQARPGRSVRCDNCGHRWPLPADMPAAAARTEPTPETHAAPPVPAALPEPATSPAEPVRAVRRIALAHGISEPRLDGRGPPVAGRPSGGSGAIVAGWLATGLVLACLAWAGYRYRAEVMTAWPPSIRLYAGLGLTQ